MKENRVIKLTESDIRRVVMEAVQNAMPVAQNGFNIKNVYHVSSEDFDDFKVKNFPYYFFSSEPIKLGDARYTYICNLSMHKPLVFSEADVWSYPLWMYLTDDDGELIPRNRLTKRRYDGYLGMPFEFWKFVYDSDYEYEVDQIPMIVKELGLGYDGVIIEDVQEGEAGGQYVDDYIVFDKSQIQIVRKVRNRNV